ncbi:hypothetical protein C0991_010484 [Blastosporella zonata]|nr:hypothetical protein C0991_010484 [Blastosporella zonata]
MPATCKECGGHTEWHDDAGSLICTNCGTLADPSQTILADPDYVSTAAVATILKSFRSQGHTLAGQSKEFREARNQFAMSEFISSLAVSLNATGLTPRATMLFKQAMTTGSFRWGRKAKLVAGASLSIALREYRRPDSLGDIAYLLDVQCSTLVRTLTSLISLLNLSLTPADPSIHISPLLAHLSSLLATPLHPHSLPAPLVSQINLISLRSAANTATNICTLLARLGPDHPLNSLPSPPTAVAVFLLALEAESRSPLSHLGDLAHALGSSCHKTSRGIVMTRYKLVQDEICIWVEQVPWLNKYEQRTANGKNRAKVGKRLIVARGIADVLQFQGEIWRGKLRPTVLLDMGDEKDEDEELESEAATSNPEPEHIPPPILAPRAPKRQKTFHHPLRDATQFLLDPLTGPLPDCEPPLEPITQSHNRITPHPPPPPPQPQPPLHDPPVSPPFFQVNAHYSILRPTQPLRLQPTTHLSSLLSPPPPPPQPTHPLPAAPPRSTQPHRLRLTTLTPFHAPQPAQPTHPIPPAPPLPPASPSRSRASLTAYILTAPSPSLLHSRAPPTRLQVLAASRGTADAIADEELFATGELEGLIRPPEEAQEVGRRMVGLGIFGVEDMDDGDYGGSKTGKAKAKKEKGKRKVRAGDEEDGQTRKSRVDLDALARFLEDPAPCAEDDKDADDAFLFGLEHFSDKDEDEELSDLEETPWSAGAAAAVIKRSTMMHMHAGGADGEEEVLVDEWRPLSPDVGAYGCGGYEEEYD